MDMLKRLGAWAMVAIFPALVTAGAWWVATTAPVAVLRWAAWPVALFGAAFLIFSFIFAASGKGDSQ